MSSNVRETIAAAQAAELKGDHSTASALLRRAAEQYRDAGNAARALKLLRHARRLEGVDEDAEVELPGEAAPLIERRPVLADPSLDAWCSFCCKPRKEVGALVAAPTGTFICVGCVKLSAGLLNTQVQAPDAPVARVAAAASFVRTPAMAAALEKLASRFRVALILGPAGVGKSALAAALPNSARVSIHDCHEPLPTADAGRLLTDLKSGRVEQVVLLVRAASPKPVMLLDSPTAQKIPIFDTASLVEAARTFVAHDLLSQVDCVVPLEPLDLPALTGLATELLAAREAHLDPATIAQLCTVALNSGRGAHELVSLISRIPAGRWQSS